MMRAILRVLVLSASWALPALSVPHLTPSALAAAPANSGTLPGPRSDPRPEKANKTVEEYQGLGMDRRLAVFAGTVLDVAECPVEDVMVDLFVDGELSGSAVTDGAGAYEIKVPYDYRGDTTVLLWYVPESRSLLPKELVIRESKVSQANSLISRCVPRAELLPGKQFRVYLFDSANRNKDLAELNCLPQ
ncbi:MAG: hypothetical protein E6K75_03260 [Candidatus Eisenbacteria bacterium]|uniref:Carboxypeptidase regulatory-like domain-containing protein n=1 Tax=Eiseniibacteriota bacterium TaxID=2212470 RepID=A0A538T9H6_UNCEI|nr:MAG: hypothetical protein E6K71_06540 [Candidatus Eisenbacteria bacterium]TMQ60184.1 MAG: hypothetical protein E6K75_03260 [Candidatus Eisenbacteria bacterium]